jgi:hypothetical protein
MLLRKGEGMGLRTMKGPINTFEAGIMDGYSVEKTCSFLKMFDGWRKNPFIT